MRVKLIVSGLFLLLFASTASAQTSVWLQKGTSGYGGQLTLRTGNDQTQIGVLGGYSYKGFIDANLGFNRYSSDQSEAEVYGIAPGVQFHPLKQSKDMPVSVGFATTFEKQFYEGPDDGWSLDLSGTVYHFFKLGKNVGVIPSAGLGFNHSSQGENSDDNVNVQLAGNFAIISGNAIWGVSPSLLIGEDVYFGINIGVVFSQVDKKK